jgi:2-dehydro-3-deoxygluconokinase
MSGLNLRPAAGCRYDVVALGEVMLRFDPGEQRIRTAREFRVWEGGGEYNVARGLRRCFGLRTAIVTALAENDIGRLVEDLILQGGVDTSLVTWVPCDGVGRNVRNGLNFTERGFGIRPARGTSDRGNTAASQITPGQIDWDHLFGAVGARWLHSGGIFAGLSDTAPAVLKEAFAAARRHGTIVSYDVNYRPSLWRATGGLARALKVNRQLAGLVDVMIGNEQHYSDCLGLAVEQTATETDELASGPFAEMVRRASEDFPNFGVVASTRRTVRTASVNDWSAAAWSPPDGFVESASRPGLEILDRIGGGDSFAAGLIYGLLTTGDLQLAVDYGAAHGALVMTTPGDTSSATLAEIEALVGGAGAHVLR